MNLFYINILIFNFLCLLRVSNPMIYFQEDGFVYSYTYKTAYTDACKTY